MVKFCPIELVPKIILQLFLRKGHIMRYFENINYTTKKCIDLSDEEIHQTSKLFSENYATYNSNASIENLSREKIDGIFIYSEERLKEAYSRMKIQEHPWAKHAQNEIDFIEQYLPEKESSLIDFGCGQGRHTAELIKRGYTNTKGYDFSKAHIVKAGKIYFQRKTLEGEFKEEIS